MPELVRSPSELKTLTRTFFPHSRNFCRGGGVKSAKFGLDFTAVAFDAAEVFFDLHSPCGRPTVCAAHVYVCPGGRPTVCAHVYVCPGVTPIISTVYLLL